MYALANFLDDELLISKISIYSIELIRIQDAYILASTALTHLRLLNLRMASEEQQNLLKLSFNVLFLLDNTIFSSYFLPKLLTFSESSYCDFSFAKSKEDVILLQFLNARIAATSVLSTVQVKMSEWPPERIMRVPGLLLSLTYELQERLEDWKNDLPEALKLQSHLASEDYESTFVVEGVDTCRLPLAAFRRQLELTYYDIRSEIGRVYFYNAPCHQSTLNSNDIKSPKSDTYSSISSDCQTDLLVQEKLESMTGYSLQYSEYFIILCTENTIKKLELCFIATHLPRLLAHTFCLFRGVTSLQPLLGKQNRESVALRACEKVLIYLSDIHEHGVCCQESQSREVNGARFRCFAGMIHQAVEDMQRALCFDLGSL